MTTLILMIKVYAFQDLWHFARDYKEVLLRHSPYGTEMAIW